MNKETKQILTRWQTLEKGGGCQRANLTGRLLSMIGLALCIFVVFAIVHQLHPAFIAIAAAAMGWTIAESNALQNRLSQWPIFRNYIDWKKVEEDLQKSQD